MSVEQNHDNLANVTAVTGFYDVGRADADGRDVATYIGWLNETLKTPLPFVVFFDPRLNADALKLKACDTIVRTPLNDFSVFSHHEEIAQICKQDKSINKRDLSFKLPAYGMLVMSKVEMLCRASQLTKADSLLWMDAGLNRFLPDLAGRPLARTSEELAGIKFGFNATSFLSSYLKAGKLPHSAVGSAKALMAAGDMIVARDNACELFGALKHMLDVDWLPNGRWDNEQVALGTLYFRGGIKGAKIITQTDGFANVTRWLFGLPAHNRKPPLYVRKEILRNRWRTFVAREIDCYFKDELLGA